MPVRVQVSPPLLGESMEDRFEKLRQRLRNIWDYHIEGAFNPVLWDTDSFSVNTVLKILVAYATVIILTVVVSG